MNNWQKFILLCLAIYGLFFLAPLVQARDAIAVRVMFNPKHLSPERWYQENVPLPGKNPRSMQLDGYEAIQDGRTIYVAGSNMNDAGNTVYSNIYVISYNEDAKETTKIIFNRIIKNWHFNTNVTNLEECDCISAGTCPNGEPLYCSSDFDCVKGGTDYGPCDANKNFLIRDTKRLADLRDIEFEFLEYAKHTGMYPPLFQGSYIRQESRSKWPSWQETLGDILDKKLSVDPLNRFWNDCPLPGYNSQTCWNESARDYQCPPRSYLYGYTSTGICSIDCSTSCVKNSDCPLYTNGEYCIGSVSAELSTNLEYKNIDWNGDVVFNSGGTNICNNLIFPTLSPLPFFNCCTPIDCAALGYVCGVYTNECGQTVSCGDCPVGEECIDGDCCTRNCAGKECGDDGCGNSCGECAPNEVCNGLYQCERVCTDECVTPGVVGCTLGLQIEICGYFDADPCLDLQITDCPAFESCDITVGTCCQDVDQDGYCSEDDGGNDCDDDDPNTNPGGIEICGDGQDNDCDGSADNCPPGQSCVDPQSNTCCPDADGDGYCDGFSDCDDTDGTVYSWCDFDLAIFPCCIH